MKEKVVEYFQVPDFILTIFISWKLLDVTINSAKDLCLIFSYLIYSGSPVIQGLGLLLIGK